VRCLVLAGGLGTRLAPVTETVPKCLIPVAGRPFAHWQLEWLASEGVTEIVYSIGHLGDLVRAEVGDGTRWGVSVRYVDDGPERRGTAGAVRLAVDDGALGDDFFVLYGDSWLSISLAAVEAAYRASTAPALMTVFRNRGRWEHPNAVLAGGMVTWYEKGLADPPPAMEYVDYGLSVLSAAVVRELVPAGHRADLAEVFTPLSRAGRLAGFEATERFYEIGSPDGLAELERLLAGSAQQAYRRG
jgi:NDP-sugar pyrophosphorylase family protein